MPLSARLTQMVKLRADTARLLHAPRTQAWLRMFMHYVQTGAMSYALAFSFLRGEPVISVAIAVALTWHMFREPNGARTCCESARTGRIG